MFCNYCGASNPDNASFCNACGKAIARPPANVAPREEVSAKIAPPGPPEETPAAFRVIDHRVGSSPEKVRTWTGHTGSIYSLAFSPDGRWLASGSLDKTAKLWNVSDGRELRTFTGNMVFTCVEFSPDGRWLVLAATNGSPLSDDKPPGNSITLWDSASPGEVRNLTGHKGQVYFVKFSPDGRWLASTNGTGPINLWDVSTGRIIKVLKPGWVRSKLLGGTFGSSLTFSRDGLILATRHMPAMLWDLSSGKGGNFGHEPLFSSSVSEFLGFTPDGKSLVQVNAFGAIRIWDLSTGTVARSLADPSKTNSVQGAALSADGSLLAVAMNSGAAEWERGEEIALWDLAAGRILGTVAVYLCFDHMPLAFSPDGLWLATGDMLYGGEKPAGRIRLWRTSEIR